ncbi:MAG: flagellin Hag [Tissierellales bacterium]|nr:flagellin Hag [Tissierellales bacterium]
MRINQNISAMNTYSRLTAANNAKSSSLAKLSSGLRINKAGDDAAGLTISEKMRGQIGGLNQAVRNAQDGISLIQTAEGALNETHSILNRMRDLAVQAANDTNTKDDRIAIQRELDQLLDEIDRIAGNTEFNTQKLFGEYGVKTTTVGSGSGATTITEASHTPLTVKFQIGANKDQNIELKINDMTTAGLGLRDFTVVSGKIVIDTSSGAKVTDLTTQSGANKAITTIDDAIKLVSEERSKLGAYQNRLEHTINNLTTTSENLSAAESRIRDVDMAEEMMKFTKNNILSQAATSMLAQANQMPQQVLQLLQ